MNISFKEIFIGILSVFPLDGHLRIVKGIFKYCEASY